MESAYLTPAHASDLDEVSALLSQPSPAFMPARAKAARSDLAKLVRAREGRAGLLLLRRGEELLGALGWRRRGRSAEIVALALGDAPEAEPSLIQQAVAFLSAQGVDSVEAWVPSQPEGLRGALVGEGFRSDPGGWRLLPFGPPRSLLASAAAGQPQERLCRSLRRPHEAGLDVLALAGPRSVATGLLVMPWLILGFAGGDSWLKTLVIGVGLVLSALSPSVAEVTFGRRIGSARAGALSFVGALLFCLALLAQGAAILRPGLGWEQALEVVLAPEAWVGATAFALSSVVAGLVARTTGRSSMPAFGAAAALGSVTAALALSASVPPLSMGLNLALEVAATVMVLALVGGYLWGGLFLIVDDLSPLRSRALDYS